MRPTEVRNLHERCRVHSLLDAQSLSTVADELVQQLEELHGEALMIELDRALRIVGVRLSQEGLGALFEEIYAAALEGCQVDPGDGRRFLQAELGGD